MNKVQKEILYEQTKKSKAMAYLLGAFFGGLGIHKFYLGANEQGLIYIGLLMISLFFPPFLLVHIFYLLFDLVYTSILCDKVNNTKRNQIEAFYTEEK